MNKCTTLSISVNLYSGFRDTYVSETRLSNLSGSEKKTRTSVQIAMLRILCVYYALCHTVATGCVHGKPNL